MMANQTLLTSWLRDYLIIIWRGSKEKSSNSCLWFPFYFRSLSPRLIKAQWPFFGNDSPMLSSHRVNKSSRLLASTFGVINTPIMNFLIPNISSLLIGLHLTGFHIYLPFSLPFLSLCANYIIRTYYNQDWKKSINILPHCVMYHFLAYVP